MEVEPLRDIEDVKRLYSWFQENRTVKEAECFLIGCNIALRIGDLLQLRFDQVDNSDKVTIRERKSGMRKDIPITKTVRDAVERLREYYSTNTFYKCESKKDWFPTYLFQSTSRRTFHMDQPFCTQHMGLAFKTAQKDLNLGYNINTHSMRKTWAYHAYKNGEDISYVQALLNHREQYTTLRYIGATKDYVEKMIVSHQLDIAG